jgi:hypothetical protein
VLAETRCGLKFTCPFKRTAGVKQLGEEVSEKDYRKLAKLVPEPVKFTGLPKRAEIARKSGNWYRVNAALTWLKDHQCHDGHWGGTEFSSATTRKKAKITYNAEFVEPGRYQSDYGWGSRANDVALTGLSLMAFDAAGIDATDADFGNTVRRAIGYLRSVQLNDGFFGPNAEGRCEFYGHATATIALAEQMVISGDSSLKPAVQAAASFILKAQNPGLGWRYGVKSDDNDSSVTGWMVLALRSALMAGARLEVREVYGSAAKWYDAAFEYTAGYPATRYHVSNDPSSEWNANGYEPTPAMDAMHICARLAINAKDWGKENKTLIAQAKHMTGSENLPTWQEKKIDYYYWNFGSLALYQMGDKFWQPWRKPLMDTLNQNQRGFRKGETVETAETLDEYGSWDAVDAWHEAGGRVYSTAMNCLTLQTEWRYTRP